MFFWSRPQNLVQLQRSPGCNSYCWPTRKFVLVVLHTRYKKTGGIPNTEDQAKVSSRGYNINLMDGWMEWSGSGAGIWLVRYSKMSAESAGCCSVSRYCNWNFLFNTAGIYPMNFKNIQILGIFKCFRKPLSCIAIRNQNVNIQTMWWLRQWYWLSPIFLGHF